MLLKTSSSAVLVNGILGPWITCKGLRQGDALSPYLFLLVADVLQALIKADMGICHPLTDGSCPVLQYADGTILLGRSRGCLVPNAYPRHVLGSHGFEDQLRQKHGHPDAPTF